MQILTCNTYLNIDMSMNRKPSKTRKEGKEMLRKGWVMGTRDIQMGRRLQGKLECGGYLLKHFMKNAIMTS